MAGLARFAFAHDADRNDINAQDADKRYKAYTCRGCGKPVLLCYGNIVTTRHFRHKHQEVPAERCDYRDETYAHKQAKAILLRQRWVAVPPVLPRRAEGYEGPLTPLRKASIVRATHVYLERTLYEDEACGLNFYRHQQTFEEDPGRKDFVCRPDVIFTDADDKPVLLVEIHVTHAVTHDKLVGLRRAQINTIEITIPWFYTAKEIEKLLASYAETKWLYNHERETTDPVGGDAAGTAPLHRAYPDEAPGIGPEPLSCQLLELNRALRSLNKFMAGAAMGTLRDRLAAARDSLEAAASREAAGFAEAIARGENELRREFAGAEAELGVEEAALRAEEARITGLYAGHQAAVSAESAALDPQLSALHRRAAPGLRKRVEERRAAYRRAEHAVAARRSQLSDCLATEEAALDRRFQRAATQLEQEEAEWTARTGGPATTERAVQERLARLSEYLESRSCREADAVQREIDRIEADACERRRLRVGYRHLDQQTATLEREERELDAEEAGIKRKEALVAACADDENSQRIRGNALRAAYQRATAAIEAECRAVEAGIARISAVRRQLVGIKDAALDRRFTRPQSVPRN